MRALLGLLLVGVVYLLFWPVRIEPVVWEPGPDRGQEAVFAPRQSLARSETLLTGGGQGPEDVALGPDGAYYAGMLDGRILRFDQQGWALFANTGGRPLGMQFNTDGHLIVADAFAGLLSVDPSGEVRVLVSEVDGIPMLFPDDLDIAGDGTIWFTDASRRFNVHDWALDFWEGRATGRLLSFQPATGTLKVHLEQLMFANGVALGPDDEFVLVSETLTARVTRLWLKGPKTGSRDIFIDGLPGYPDNLSFDGELFWIALPSPRQPAIEQLASFRPWLRRARAASGPADRVAAAAGPASPPAPSLLPSLILSPPPPSPPPYAPGQLDPDTRVGMSCLVRAAAARLLWSPALLW